MCRIRILLLAVATITTAPTVVRAQGYQARVMQVDRKQHPKVVVLASITDSAGKAVPADLPLTAEIVEDGKLVSTVKLGTGTAKRNTDPVAVVLVLDTSGSMKGPKLQAAKDAATAFVRNAPSHYQIGLVEFESRVRIVSPLTNDRLLLEREINALLDKGATALQDGIGKGIELLEGVAGRRVVLALTDGQENESSVWSKDRGPEPLIDFALQKGCTISVIGLGSDVHRDYLQRYERSGGFFLFSPSESELLSRFEAARELLQSEWRFEYASPFPSDGRARSVSVRLLLEGSQVAASTARYVSPGLVPNVRGSHAPFLVMLLALALAPKTRSGLRYWRETRQFRMNQVRRLQANDPQLGKNDQNGGRLELGQLVVLCPSCQYPQQVRTWRYCGCKCPRGCAGERRYCQVALLPRWLRVAIDKLFGGPVGEGGRTWLCRCKGDPEGR